MILRRNTHSKRTRKVDDGGAGVRLDARVGKVVHEAHHRGQDLGVLLLLRSGSERAAE